MADSLPRLGQLRYETSTSSPQTEAGREFSISVKVTNPFDHPVLLRAVTTKLPVDFVDVTRELLTARQSDLEEHLRELVRERAPHLAVKEDRKRELALSVFKEMMRSLPFLGGALASTVDVAEYIRASNVSAVASLSQAPEPVSGEEILRLLDAADKAPNPEASLQQGVVRLLEERFRTVREELHTPVLLQPGNSTIHVFTVRSKGTLLFRPSTYKLFIEIQYEVNSTIQRDVVEFALSVSASLKTLMVGAAFGSAAGYLVRDALSRAPAESFLAGSAGGAQFTALLIANIILAVIAVIVFARKKDVQPLLSIEDFWGGILIGFLTGYSGQSFLKGLVPAP